MTALVRLRRALGGRTVELDQRVILALQRGLYDCTKPWPIAPGKTRADLRIRNTMPRELLLDRGHHFRNRIVINANTRPSVIELRVGVRHDKAAVPRTTSV